MFKKINFINMLILPYNYGDITMMRKDVDVLKYLLDNKEMQFSVKQISEKVHIDYKNMYELIKRLQKEKIVLLKKIGNSYQINIIYSEHPLIYEAEYRRKFELLKNKNLKLVLEYFKDISEFHIMLIFGSYSKNKQNKHSDIDLMFIVSDEMHEKFEKKVHEISSLIPLKLHIYVFSQKEFIAMKNSKELTVGSEAIQNNVILHGIELYYRLMK